jgi:hypothetical protein
MPIRFAAAVDGRAPRLSRTAARAALRRPANDNGQKMPSDERLHAALRHFGRHGMAAARTARLQAEVAFFAGDQQGYAHWLDICRALDRRMAGDLGSHRFLRDGQFPVTTGGKPAS